MWEIMGGLHEPSQPTLLLSRDSFRQCIKIIQTFWFHREPWHGFSTFTTQQTLRYSEESIDCTVVSLQRSASSPFAFWVAFALNSTGLPSNNPTESTASSLMTQYPAVSVWVSVEQEGFIEVLQNVKTTGLSSGQAHMHQYTAHINTYRSQNHSESIWQKRHTRNTYRNTQTCFSPIQQYNNWRANSVF